MEAELLKSLKETRRWLNYFLGEVYSVGADDIACKRCGCKAVLNEKRTGARIDHDPEQACGKAAAAIYAANDVIEMADGRE